MNQMRKRDFFHGMGRLGENLEFAFREFAIDLNTLFKGYHFVSIANAYSHHMWNSMHIFHWQQIFSPELKKHL